MTEKYSINLEDLTLEDLTKIADGNNYQVGQVLAEKAKALSEAILKQQNIATDIGDLLDRVREVDPQSKQEAEVIIPLLKEIFTEARNKLAEVGLEWEIFVELSNGEMLDLHNNYTYGSNKWYTSSDQC